MEKEEKEFFETLSELSKQLINLKEEIEKEMASENAEVEVEETEQEDRTFTLSEIKKIIKNASEKTEKDLEEMMKVESFPSLLLRIQNIAVLEIFKTNLEEGIDGHE